MKISISILFLALFLSLANSSDTPCPDNGYRVDYKDPYSSTKKSICYTTKNGKDIKHGPEIHRNETGKVIKKLYYHYGQATTAKKTAPQKEKKQDDDLQKQAQSLVEGLLRSAFASKNAKYNLGTFSTTSCKGDIQQWVQLYISSRPFSAQYHFDKNCDLDGSWRPQLNTPFKAIFKLRNLEPYTKTKLTLKTTLQRKGKHAKISFFVEDGKIFSPKGHLTFTAKYFFLIDVMDAMMKKRIDPLEQEGEIHFLNIYEKEVDLVEEINIRFL